MGESQRAYRLTAKHSFGVEPARGLEPPTCALQVRCSTFELRRLAGDRTGYPAVAFGQYALGEHLAVLEVLLDFPLDSLQRIID